jgi:hypothetical protein
MSKFIESPGHLLKELWNDQNVLTNLYRFTLSKKNTNSLMTNFVSLIYQLMPKVKIRIKFMLSRHFIDKTFDVEIV